MVSSRLAQRRRCDSFVIFMDMPPLRFRAHGVVVHPVSPTLVSLSRGRRCRQSVRYHETLHARGVRKKAGENDWDAIGHASQPCGEGIIRSWSFFASLTDLRVRDSAGGTKSRFLPGGRVRQRAGKYVRRYM